MGSPPLRGKATGLEVYDDGSGPALAALHDDHVTRFRSGVWTPLPGFFDLAPGQAGGARLDSILYFDDGHGPALYVSGYFQRLDDQIVANVVRFDGMQWESVGAGLPGAGVTDLHLHDFGSGPELVAGGRFTQSGGVPIGRVARWTGTSWVTVGSSPPNGPVRVLTSWHDGTVNRLIAGGNFGSADGVPAVGVASFDGTSWSALGQGLSLTSNLSTKGPYAMTTEGGASGRLIVGGLFDSAGGLPISDLAVWDGTNWENYRQNLEPVSSANFNQITLLTRFDFGEGTQTVVGGEFSVDSSSGRDLARRVGTTWQRLAPGAGTSGDIRNVTDGLVWDDGQVEKFYVAGFFQSLGDLPAIGIVRRTTNGVWEEASAGLEFSSVAPRTVGLIAHEGPFRGSSVDQTGLYALGNFSRVNGVGSGGVARFDGVQWNAVSGGLEFNISLNNLRAFRVFDDGSGPRLFVVGSDSVRVWDGLAWTSLLPVTGWFTFTPRALAVYDDGSGPALYLGGRFQPQGGPSTPLVRRTGTQFAPAPQPNASGFVSETAWDLTVYDDGSGPKLWLAGNSYDTSSVFHPGGLASYDGSQIVGYATPLDEGYALEVFENDGGPTELLVGGNVQLPTPSGTVRGGAVHRFGQSGYEEFNEGVASLFRGRALDGSSAIFAGGDFTLQSDFQSSGWAEMTRTCSAGAAYCFGDGGPNTNCTPCPCNNNASPGSRSGCINASGSGSTLIATGNPSASSDTLRFETRNMPQMTGGTLFSGSHRLPSNPANPCFGLDSGIANLGDGLRCMGGNARRHGARFSDSNGDIGNTNSGWGWQSAPAGGLISFAGFTPGQTRHFQVLHRDSGTSGCGSGLNATQGISITFQP